MGGLPIDGQYNRQGKTRIAYMYTICVSSLMHCIDTHRTFHVLARIGGDESKVSVLGKPELHVLYV